MEIPETRAPGPCNVEEALTQLPGPWQPHRLASLNDHEVKVVSLPGEFVWHTHPGTDELFHVIQGEVTIQRRDGNVVPGPQEVFVVPRGVEHCPVPTEGAQAIPIERAGAINTGDAGGDLTSPLRELP
ncbi:cupin domain-containing protein [Brachybacterium squillarum]|uniref:cupin domain-containing protein n=1 Tax=Brachybacterium squillarum TaxID=661979 RepID=UPI00026298DC|nr:cupin domain-containing protein [Brachybacterium squillarum]